MKENKAIINHEKIHFCQQLELLILPFYLLYILNYLVNLVRYKNHDRAYFNLCFEREAYADDKNADYIRGRSLFSWLKHL